MFFDPIGQALCKRTMNLVESLNEKHADRVHFYLSKADEAGHESDRQVLLTYTLPIDQFTKILKFVWIPYSLDGCS